VRISTSSTSDEYKTERESFSKIVAYKNSAALIIIIGKYWTKAAQSTTTDYDRLQIAVTGKTAIRKWACTTYSI